MIEINGSEGEGGGQIVRSSLALAAVTGQPIRLTNIRGGRKKPGLLRQHLAGVRAIKQVCSGDVSGDQLGSNELTLVPGELSGGDHCFEVGSAGSAILVAQTILPVLLHADAPSTIEIGGGTHAAWAPPFDFFRRCYLPLLARMNANVEVDLESHGFYPAGGGRMVMKVTPSSGMNGLTLTDRIGKLKPKVTALVSRIPASVGERECDLIARKTGWDKKAFQVLDVPRAGGPGNVVMIELGFDNVCELIIGFGKIGVKAEQIARATLREARAHLASEVPVGAYLADQLLLPMGLAARHGHRSEFRTGPLSQHSQTHIEVLQRFLDVKIQSVTDENGSVHVSVEGNEG
ncbi:RNA 3'-terminal phosphate cyclase [Rhodopirellula islandica]|uniref:RNA 3'-terminal phosphate cyclase n=1 Tax=Rhodopirellula islandica TaxID=595434 RepID=A0A0J1BN54_RHOIS|nr:RNA 3'-terminal phosphate cyclase [Rhodopirellula islandica]KLU07896.1 RNA 3'-terminal phosphate cyclase [Rhodopirellula islandica]